MNDALFSELETHTAHVTADLPALIDASIAVAQDEQALGTVQTCQAGDQGERTRKRSRSIQPQCCDTPSDRRIALKTTIVQNDIPTHGEFIYRTRGESSSPEDALRFGGSSRDSRNAYDAEAAQAPSLVGKDGLNGNDNMHRRHPEWMSWKCG
jgi:hypothetical protein